MDPFEAFNQSAESNRGNYDPFSAFNKFAGMEQMVPTSKSITAQNSDKHWPLVKINIPGSKSILVRALPLENTSGKPFSMSLKGNQLIITPGLIGGVLPSDLKSNLKYVLDLNQQGGSLSYVVANVTASANPNTITGATITIDSTLPQPNAPAMGAAPTNFKILLGIINGSNITSIIQDNVACYLFEAGKTTVQTPTPGMPLWDIWYNWAIK